MGKYSIEIENEAKKELAAHYKSGDRKTIKRIERIFKELAETPYDGIGSPEPLKYELSGYWSRQINKKDEMKIPPSRWHFLCSKHDILYPASYEFGQNDCTIAMTTINPNTTRMSNTTTPNMRSDFFSCWHRGISCRTWR